jgi:hypothetical protein
MDMKMVSEEEVVKKYRKYLLKTVVEPIVVVNGKGVFLNDFNVYRVNST